MIAIINGPNLNLTGRREPEIYGDRSFADFIEELRQKYPAETVEYFHSNCEGAIIDTIQKYGCGFSDECLGKCEGIIINPGAYSHYSIAIADAIGAAEVPVVEVHISNIHSREDFRRSSVTAVKATGVIAGLGLEGYELALRFLLRCDG